MSSTSTIEPTRWGEREIRGPVHQFREDLLLRRFGPMFAQGRILDAGCGSGSLALALCQRGLRVEAVELSEPFTRLLQKKIGAAGLSRRLSIARASVMRLPFGDGEFDGLVCGEVLEHLDPKWGGDRAAVAEFFRVLKPGSPCVISVPLNQGQWDHSDQWAGHVKRYDRRELIQLFEDAGFAVEDVRVWGFPLGRLYHRFLFAPWLRRSGGPRKREKEGLGARAAGNNLATKAVATALRFDELFDRFPWGRGAVLAARRP